MLEKIIELLGRGISQSSVAMAVGVSDGYISQLMADEEIKRRVQELRLKHLQAFTDHDDEVDDLESKALRKLHSLLPFVSKPMEAVRIFQVANTAKRKAEGVDPTQTGHVTAPIVQLNLPASAAVHFKLSMDKQVVEVEGRSLATLPSKELNKQLAERRENVPLISDATTAQALLQNVAKGVPEQSIANLL